MPAIPAKEYDEAIRRLEVGLRQLKVLYDQFFVGALDTPPVQLRRELEQIMDQINRNPPDKLVMRFRYNAVLGRYNCYAELWNKTMRIAEEGGRRSISVSERLGLRERLLTRCVVPAKGADNEDLRRLHQRFVAARERQGRRGIPFEKFARGIARQATQLRDRHGCDQIELRLVERGENLEIRARPGSSPARRSGAS